MGEDYRGYVADPRKYTWDEMIELVKQDRKARDAYRENPRTTMEFLSNKGYWTISGCHIPTAVIYDNFFYRLRVIHPLKNLRAIRGVKIKNHFGQTFTISDANENLAVVNGRLVGAQELFDNYTYENGTKIGE